MRHTKQTSYAVRILLRCPKNDEGYVRASDIARLEGITRYNVLKIMPRLARAGFITTNRGRTGGVKLARPACEIDLGDVFRATELTHIEKEFAEGGLRSLKSKRLSPVSMMLDKAMQAFIGALEGNSLADLMELRTPGKRQDGGARSRTQSARKP